MHVNNHIKDLPSKEQNYFTVAFARLAIFNQYFTWTDFPLLFFPSLLFFFLLPCPDSYCYFPQESERWR
jgi:hypothetical protein